MRNVGQELRVAQCRIRGLLSQEGIATPTPCMPVGRSGLAVPVLNWLNDYGGQALRNQPRRARLRPDAKRLYYLRRSAMRSYGSRIRTLWACAASVNRYIDAHLMAGNLPDLWAAAAFLSHLDAYADFEQLTS